jgi:hypothetical protein
MNFTGWDANWIEHKLNSNSSDFNWVHLKIQWILRTDVIWLGWISFQLNETEFWFNWISIQSNQFDSMKSAWIMFEFEFNQK